MTLKVKRISDNEGVLVTIDKNKYLVVVCAGVTHSDHDSIKNELIQELGKNTDIDLYYTRNLLSVFIFDVETLEGLTNNDIVALLPDVEHRTVHNGAIYGNSKISDFSLVRYNREVKLSKKFNTLFTMREG